jgi:hypothetical protein
MIRLRTLLIFIALSATLVALTALFLSPRPCDHYTHARSQDGFTYFSCGTGTRP